MSKTENAFSAATQPDALQDDELESVIGGCCTGVHLVAHPVSGVAGIQFLPPGPCKSFGQ